MDPVETPKWPQTRAEARAVQAALAERVVVLNHIDEPRTIAAVETAYGTGGEMIYAVAVVTSFPEITEIERSSASAPVTFPYVPGLLAFREGPVILEALGGLQTSPDLLIVHGHGISHPNRVGLASHIGVMTDMPTIGCCRRLLSGRHAVVGETKGSAQPIVLHGRTVGRAYRSKDRVKPIYISPAHKCDLDFAQDIIVRNLRGYRLPEPLRLAHLFANKYKRYCEKRASNGVSSNPTP